MTKTYSEQYQAVLFKAAREARKIAGQVLDDMQNDVELTSETSHIWARSTAKHYADKATELENTAHEVAIASNYAEALQRKSRGLYTSTINAYEDRRRAAQKRVSVVES